MSVIVLIIFLHEAFVAIEKEIEPVDESMIWWNMQNKIQGSPCSLYLELDDIQ
jgi:hypothetical protein